MGDQVKYNRISNWSFRSEFTPLDWLFWLFMVVVGIWLAVLVRLSGVA